MVWGNCVPQESLETSVEGRMWNGFKLRIGIVVGMLNYQVFVSRASGCLRLLAFWCTVLGTFLFCLHFERIKIFSVEITVRYSVWSWERWWRAEAHTCLCLLVIIRNTTNLSVIKQTIQRQNMYWNHGKTSFGPAPYHLPHAVTLHPPPYCPFCPPVILFPVTLLFITTDNLRHEQSLWTAVESGRIYGSKLKGGFFIFGIPMSFAE